MVERFCVGHRLLAAGPQPLHTDDTMVERPHPLERPPFQRVQVYACRGITLKSPGLNVRRLFPSPDAKGNWMLSASLRRVVSSESGDRQPGRIREVGQKGRSENDCLNKIRLMSTARRSTVIELEESAYRKTRVAMLRKHIAKSARPTLGPQRRKFVVGVETGSDDLTSGSKGYVDSDFAGKGQHA